MKFAIVDPWAKNVALVDAAGMKEAEEAAGLEAGHVDFGSVARGVGIVVFEFGLFDPPDKQRYFSINGGLYAGKAVLYAYGDDGETIDIEVWP